MDALTALQKRVSVPRLGGVAPSRDTRDEIYSAALRVPDHAQLKPWRFFEIEGDGLVQLGEVFVEALEQQMLADGEVASARQIVKARGKPLRAPLMIIVVASPVEHPKVPEIEQVLSAGCAAQNMLIACHALGVGAVWRTGSMAYDKTVKRKLGLSEFEHIVAFLYLGEPEGRIRVAPEVAVEEYFESWPTQN